MLKKFICWLFYKSGKDLLQEKGELKGFGGQEDNHVLLLCKQATNKYAMLEGNIFAGENYCQPEKNGS